MGGAVKNPKGLPHGMQPGERARLLVAQGPAKGTAFTLMGDRISVGRKDCDVDLDDSTVSRHHLDLLWNGDHYQAIDMGSSNGFVHNRKLLRNAPLRPGDAVLLGSTVVEIYDKGAFRARASGQESGELRRQRERDSIEKAKVAKNRIVVLLVVFLLVMMAWSSSDEKVKTFKERARIPVEEVEAAQKKKKLDPKAAKEALEQIVTGKASSTEQREGAEKFFHDGVRELQNRNFRRAIISFETAVTVDPNHNMAKFYLKTAYTEFFKEIRQMFHAGVQADRAFRLADARINYEGVMASLPNILVYLERSKDDRSETSQKKLWSEAKEIEKQTTEGLKRISDREGRKQ